MSGWTLAKPVILKAKDGRLVMAVLTAAQSVDLKAAASVVGSDVELAQEKEFAASFPGCEAGAEPPFGNLYGLPRDTAVWLATQSEVEASRKQRAAGPLCAAREINPRHF